MGALIEPSDEAIASVRSRGAVDAGERRLPAQAIVDRCDPDHYPGSDGTPW